MTMKKRYLCLGWMAALLLGALPLSAQERVVERTFLSTDKDVYVAGENVWYSAFCLDAGTLRYSPVSSVAYVELHSADGLAATSKVALVGGRGGGGDACQHHRGHGHRTRTRWIIITRAWHPRRSRFSTSSHPSG